DPAALGGCGDSGGHDDGHLDPDDTDEGSTTCAAATSIPTTPQLPRPRRIVVPDSYLDDSDCYGAPGCDPTSTRPRRLRQLPRAWRLSRLRRLGNSCGYMPRHLRPDYLDTDDQAVAAWTRPQRHDYMQLQPQIHNLYAPFDTDEANDAGGRS
ncbi:unnamed protein product, partial [Urochloa humidicola]